jgi:hypothetical protein
MMVEVTRCLLSFWRGPCADPTTAAANPAMTPVPAPGPVGEVAPSLPPLRKNLLIHSLFNFVSCDLWQFRFTDDDRSCMQHPLRRKQHRRQQRWSPPLCRQWARVRRDRRCCRAPPGGWAPAAACPRRLRSCCSSQLGDYWYDHSHHHIALLFHIFFLSLRCFNFIYSRAREEWHVLFFLLCKRRVCCTHYYYRFSICSWIIQGIELAIFQYVTTGILYIVNLFHCIIQ